MIWRILFVLGNVALLWLLLPELAFADNCSGPSDCSRSPLTGVVGGAGVAAGAGLLSGWLGRAIEYSPIGFWTHTYGFFTGKMPLSGDRVWFDSETAKNLPGEYWDDFSKGHARDRLYAFTERLATGESYEKAVEDIARELKVAADFYTSGRVMEGISETPLLETMADGLQATGRDLARKAVAEDGGVEFARTVADLTARAQIDAITGEAGTAGLNAARRAAGLTGRAGAAAASEAGSAAGQAARTAQRGAAEAADAGSAAGQAARAAERGAAEVADAGGAAGRAGRAAERGAAEGGDAARAAESQGSGARAGADAEAPTRRMGPETEAPTRRMGPEADAPTRRMGPETEAPTRRLDAEDTTPTRRLDPEDTTPTRRMGPEAEAPTRRMGPEAEAPTRRMGPEAGQPPNEFGAGPGGPRDPNATTRLGDAEWDSSRGFTPTEKQAKMDYIKMRGAENQMDIPSLQDPRSQSIIRAQHQEALDNMMKGMRNDPNYLDNFSHLQPDELAHLRDQLGKAGASPADLRYLDDQIARAGGPPSAGSAPGAASVDPPGAQPPSRGVGPSTAAMRTPDPASEQNSSGPPSPPPTPPVTPPDQER